MLEKILVKISPLPPTVNSGRKVAESAKGNEMGRRPVGHTGPDLRERWSRKYMRETEAKEASPDDAPWDVERDYVCVAQAQIAMCMLDYESVLV